jgi:1,4-dihydroxy-2-naphthoyl-CoA hydrolase
MSIWNKTYQLEELNAMRKDTILTALGIEFTELGSNFLKASMPVDQRTVQPAGILHGGASVVLAETLGSLASTLIVDTSRYFCVGLEVNANHIRPGLAGKVHGQATPIHLGKSTHIWHIIVTNDDEKLVCVSRLTIAVREKNN